MKTTVIKSVFQFRRASADEWESVNPILRVGEPGYDITNKKHKIGDGETAWNELPYQEGNGSVSGDINWDQIINAPTKLSDFENDLDIEETDPTVPDWAKQAEKPAYDYDEIEGTPDLTQYATTNYVNEETVKVKSEITSLSEKVENISAGKDPLFISAQKFHDRPGTTLSYAIDAKDFSRVASIGEKANLVITNAEDADGVWSYFCEATVESIAATDEEGNATIYAVVLSSICDLTPSSTGSLSVTSVNGKTGAVVIEVSDIIKTSTGANKISVASDGTLEVNSITVDKLIQDEEDEVVISGGNA